jgi:hypothetical protein
MTMEKLDGTWPPIVNPRILVQNRLRDKAIHVIILPNEDYQLAEVLVAFSSIGSSALSMVKTANDLVLVLRTLSLIKNAKAVIDKLKDVIPKSSITLLPGQQREVYNALLQDPLLWLNPTGIIGLFGGETFTIIITDEDFKNTVKFNTGLAAEYTVDETGVAPPMHYWNSGYVVSGLRSSAPPSLTRIGQNDMLMAYRDSKGERIFMAEFKDGHWASKGRGWINADSKQGIGATVMQGNLCLVARHGKGDQMFSLWQSDQEIPFGASMKWMGPDIQGKPSATTVGNTTYAVAKHYPGNAVMWAIRHADGRTDHGNTMLNTEYPPSIHAYKGKLYLFFTRMDNRNICVAVSDDGRNWREVHNDLRRTSAGVALTVYKDRLYVIFRDGDGNGVFYMWTEDGSNFRRPRDEYFGFDVAGEPTASPMPGDDNGIMIAGILPAEWSISAPWSFPDAEAIIWTILMPSEPRKASRRSRQSPERPAAAAKKPAVKKAVSKGA